MASSYTERLIGAAKLDADTYEEVEADPSALGQAMATVVLASIAAGIGTFGDGGISGLVMVTLGSLIGWFIWAGLTYLIGTKMLPEEQTEADIGQLLRTTGFASSPGLLRILGIVPVLGALVGLIVSVWMLIAFVVAVRQALDYKSTGRAVAVCLIGFVVYLAFVIGLSLVAGVGAAIFGG
jgi:hypothetical protein